MSNYTTTNEGPTKKVRVIDFLSSINANAFDMYVSSLDDLRAQLAAKKIGNPDPSNPPSLRVYDGVLSSQQPPKGYDWLVTIGDEDTEEDF